MTRKIKLSGWQLVLIIILALLILLIGAAGVYIYKCTHYWQGDYKRAIAAGFTEKQTILPDGAIINYAEGPANGAALLLIHGQSGAWQDYTRVLPALSDNWHVFVVDCYGHGASSHDEAKYYLKENGDDLIWFTENIIAKETMVSGHSSGGLLAAYVAAYGGDFITGAVLEDPPVFSTEAEYFENSFAYQDTYKLLHAYGAGNYTWR